MSIPVFLFTGFLDAGKTTLIRQMLTDRMLTLPKGPVLLVLTETGLESYSEDFLRRNNLNCRLLRSAEEFGNLEGMRAECGGRSVVIELNGFWPSTLVDQALVENWRITEKIFCANAETAALYDANLNGPTRDKIAFCSRAFLNRIPEGEDGLRLHRLVRQYGKRAEIFFQRAGGVWQPSPWEEISFYADPNGDGLTEIPDYAFAEWLYSVRRHPASHAGNRVRVRGLFRSNPQGRPLLGREITTGSTRDAEFQGLTLELSEQEGLRSGTWYLVTAEICVLPGGEAALRAGVWEETYPPMQGVAVLP